MPYDCFISYSSIDLGYAQELYDKLTQQHFKVWFDKVRLNPGFNWHFEIEAGCDDSRILLPILTPRWKESEWTKFETYSGEYIIPLIIEGDWDDVKTPPLERFQAEKLDFTTIDQAHWDKLFSHISKKLADISPDKNKRVISLKYLPNPHFVGRDNDLIKIHELLHKNPTTTATQGKISAIIGNGGYGKTTLARQYAEKFWKCYNQILWIDGRLDIETEFAFIYNHLFPARIYSGLSNKEKAREAFNELMTFTSRLLIIDNVESEASIKNWVPNIGGCHVLITSRNANWSAAIWKINIDVLSSEAAEIFLQKHTGRELTGNELQACKELARKLGNLPLALEQAAAYIEQQGEEFGFSNYLILLEKATKELLASGTPGSTDYEQSVFSTWKPSIDKLSSPARTILRLASHFGTTPIPISMFINGASEICKLTNKIYETEDEITGDMEFWVRDHLTKLKNYCLIKMDGHSFSLHPLLQLIERIGNNDAFNNIVYKCAEEIFVNSVPGASWAEDKRIDWKPADDDQWKQLLPHGLSLMEWNENNYSASLLKEISNAYATAGSFEEALDISQKSYAQAVKTFGESDPKTIDILEDLAYLNRQLNINDKSLELFKQVYNKRIEIQGQNHEFALRTLHNVAIVERLLGKFELAYEKMKNVLEMRKNQFGEKNYYTLTSIHDIGYLLDGWGKEEESIPYYKKALEEWEISPGPDNPDTITAYINLTGCYKTINDYEKALEYNQKAIEGSSKKQGRNLIYFQRSCSDKIDILFLLEKYQEAKEFCSALVVQLNDKFGFLDPMTIEFKFKLSDIYQYLNEPAHSYEIFKELLANAKNSLPITHSVYQIILYNIFIRSTYSTDPQVLQLLKSEADNLMDSEKTNCSNYFFNKGTEYFDNKDYQTSKKYYLLCENIRAKQNPFSHELARAYNGVAAACTRLEEWDEAENAALRSLKIDPDFPYPGYWLAKAYEGRKNDGDATKEYEAWKKYLELGPTSDERKKEALKRISILKLLN